VLGDGLHERSVRSGAAGAEGDEAPAIRSHDRHGLTDDRLTVAGRPTVRRPGDNEVHGLKPRGLLKLADPDWLVVQSVV